MHQPIPAADEELDLTFLWRKSYITEEAVENSLEWRTVQFLDFAAHNFYQCIINPCTPESPLQDDLQGFDELLETCFVDDELPNRASWRIQIQGLQHLKSHHQLDRP